MAEFNPRTGDTQTPNFTNRAPDIGPNRAFETLFSGLGDLIDNATTTADTRIKSKIENDARYGFDSLNDEMNLSPDTTSGGDIPPELTRTQDGLTRLAQAHIQGKVTPEYYYQRLASQMKALRAKYPGYEKEVDDIVTNVTGTRPANAYRDALFQNIQNEQTALASKKGMFDKWLAKDQNMGLAVTMFPDILTNPEKYADDDTKAKVMTTVEGQQGRLQQTKNAADLQNADKTIATPALSQYTSQIVQSHLHGAVEGTTIGKDDNLLSTVLADGQITPDEKAQVLTYIAQTKQAARQDVLSRWGRGEMGKNFTRDEINKEVDASLSDLTQIETFVNNGELDQAAQAGDRLKAMQDQNTMDLYKKFPELKTANTIGQFSPDASKVLMDEIIKKNGGGLNFLNKALASDLTLSSLSNPEQMPFDKQLEVIESAKGKTGKEKEAILGTVINNQLDALKSGKLSPEQTKSYVSQNYDKSIDSLFNAVDDSLVDGTSQRMRLYQKMFDPKITASIKNSGDPQSMKQYLAAAFDKAQQVPEFRRAAADLKEDMDYSKFVRVAYDAETNRIEVRVNRDALKKQALDQQYTDPAQKMDMFDSKVTQIQKAASSYNQVLGSLVPIIEASGQDEMKGVQEFSRNLSLNLNGGKDQGFFGYVDKEIRDLNTARSPTERDEQGKEVPKDSPTKDWEDLPSAFDSSADDGEIDWGDEAGDALHPMAYRAEDSRPDAFAAVLRDGESPRVVDRGAGFTTFELPDGRTIKRKGTFAWRNNNPGNIEDGRFAKNQSGYVPGGGRFAAFRTFADGQRARENLLFNSPKYKNKTLAEAITRYAPPSENNTDRYISILAKAAGVTPDTKMSDMTMEQRRAILKAQESVEDNRIGKEIELTGA